jgi:hypothetical protein
MIADLKQSARNWLGDHLQNFDKMLAAGDDPSCMIVLPGGVEVEIRLNRFPGVFERQIIPVVGEPEVKGDD